jgi:predicted AlkP superfamily phosphohydrolase/phosphomutase/tetratricopeptide (TPR) repeat protein
MAKRIAKKILLLGWDAADWQIINRLIAAGQMPHMESLINRGTMGNLATLEPVLSPMLWSSIATGKRADKHGVFGFIEPKPDGSGVRPVTSTSLKAQPLWNIIEEHGLKSAVVGWFATHPASALKGTVVSNHFHPPIGDKFDDWKMPDDCISPESLREALHDMRIHPEDLIPEQILSFVPNAQTIDPQNDPRMASLIKLLTQTFTVHAAGTYLAEHTEWDLLAVYYDAIDRLGHDFMECHPPKMPHISDEDFHLYSGVIDQIYRFHDMMLGRYMELVDEDTTIMVVSDHGFFNDHLRPAAVEKGAGRREPVRWHRDFGIFVAAGPGIREDQLTYGASLLDIAPTTLAMLGLPVAEDMEGRVLQQIFSEPLDIDLVESYGAPNAAESGEDADPWAAQQLMQQFIALGYVEDTSDDDAAEAIEKANLQRLANLSQVYMSVRKFAQAAELLEELLTIKPDDFRSKLRLAQCHLNMGNKEACRATVDEALADREQSPWGNLLAGMLSSAEGEPEKALEHFKRAQDHGPNMPQLHNRIGRIRLQQKNWPAAEEAFTTALGIDGDSADAFRGLGIAIYQQQRYEEAAESLLRAVALQYHQPVAHCFLGLALMASGRLTEAIRTLNVSIEQEDSMVDAHKALVQIYEARGNEEQALFHRSIVRIKNREQEATAAAQ